MTDFTTPRLFASVLLLAVAALNVPCAAHADPARPLKSKPVAAVKKAPAAIAPAVGSGKTVKEGKAASPAKDMDSGAKDGETKMEAAASAGDDEKDPDETTYGLVEKDPTGDHYTSVIIDASDYHCTPSMSPKVCRPDGTKLWPTLAFIDPDYVISYGIVVYAHSLEEAKSHKRAGKNPLVIRASGHGKSADDPIISETDALLILAANKRNQCMDKFKVIYILDKK